MLNEEQHKMLTVAAALSGRVEVTFLYTDTDGVQSVRYVRPSSIERNLQGKLFIRGLDVQRNAQRSFCYDKMTQVKLGIAAPLTVIL